MNVSITLIIKYQLGLKLVWFYYKYFVISYQLKTDNDGLNID